MNLQNILHQEVTFEEVSMSQLKFYWITGLFTIANVIFPVILHQFPSGGRMFLPIYFFTLIAGYRFGWRAGVITALASALASFALTGMPPIPVLPFVLFKGVLLGLFAGIVARYSRLPLLLSLLLIVFLYQFCGAIFEWFMLHNLTLVLADITTGYMGLLLQIFGGAALISMIDSTWKKNH